MPLTKAEKFLLTIEPFNEWIPKLTIDQFERQASVFNELVAGIIYQQISIKAAASIHNKLNQRMGGPSFSPANILEHSLEDLRSCGLSGQKASYILNIASFFQENKLHDHSWDKMSDEQIIDYLTEIKGVGVWTVQMLLMFYFERPDVFPERDLGIQLAMKGMFGLTEEKKDLIAKMNIIAEAWKPHRTTASKYLWAWKRLH